jgi:signal peptidase II
MVVPCVACDQATKVIASQILESGPIEYFGGFVQFRLVHNPGAFLSLGAQLPEGVRDFLFQGVVPLLLAVAVIVLMRSMAPTRTAIVGASLILGGGLGNFIDRTLHEGGVVDFVSIGFSGLRTGVFNVADVAIIGGVLMVLWEQHRTPEPVETTAADSPMQEGSGEDASVFPPATSPPRPPPQSTSR